MKKKRETLSLGIIVRCLFSEFVAQLFMCQLSLFISYTEHVPVHPMGEGGMVGGGAKDGRQEG